MYIFCWYPVQIGGSHDTLLNLSLFLFIFTVFLIPTLLVICDSQLHLNSREASGCPLPELQPRNSLYTVNLVTSMYLPCFFHYFQGMSVAENHCHVLAHYSIPLGFQLSLVKEYSEESREEFKERKTINTATSLFFVTTFVCLSLISPYFAFKKHKNLLISDKQ